MNCKPGDLAVIVKSMCGLEGKIIRVVEYVGALKTHLYTDLWRLESEIPAIHVISRKKTTSLYFSDSCLRPIRDQPGNESWFTAAPKSLPATTKGDTITERGELQS